jgi:hypothetical protein
MLMRLLIVLVGLAYSTSVHAQINRAEINKALKSINPPVKIKHQGKDGLWFPEDEAETILRLLEEKLPQALDLIDSQEKQAAALKSAIEGYKAASTSYKDVANFNQNALKVALSYFPELNPPKYSWYEGRTAFYMYGVLTGVTVIIVSAWVLDKTQNDN